MTWILGTTIKGDEFDSWIFGAIFFVPLALGGIYLIYKQLQLLKWKKGVYPIKTKFSKDNLLEAYICLSAYMIQRDKRDVAEKMKFIRSHFHRYFAEGDFDLNASLKWSYDYPLQPATVALWISKNIKEHSKRSQILYFLAGLAMVDGELIQREYAILKEITPLLGLSEKELDAIINMYRKSSEDQQQTSTKSTYTASRKELAFGILELAVGAPENEIKMAYRRLAKLHHPDKFMNESPEQIRMANERFMKIQQAYELLNS
jgi:DnaJ like chaperone protein